jgi:hypothetical protein
VLLLALALHLRAHGSSPPNRRPGQAPPRAVIERTPGPAAPTSSRTGQATRKRGARASQTVRREREPRLAPAVAPREGRAAATAERIFLHAYVPYSYGRGDADRIHGAARAVVSALRDAPPRVPPSVSRARPRLESVVASAATGGRDVLVVAAVDDGARRYDVRLTLHRSANRWVVTEISG